MRLFVLLILVLVFGSLSFADQGFTLQVDCPSTGQPNVPFDVTATLCDAYGHPIGTGTDLCYIAVDRLGQQAGHMVDGVVTFHNVKSRFVGGSAQVVVTDPTHNLTKVSYMKQG